jgi:hypothetical protein
LTPRTAAPPPADRHMWRILLRRVHPDHGGSHDLFVWARALYEYIAGDAIEPPPQEARRKPPQHPTTGERVPFHSAYDRAQSFEDLTCQAVAMADDLPEPYAAVLLLLVDCYEAGRADVVNYRAQNQGATYKQLAYISHLLGMSNTERSGWYRVAESVPLSQRHARHILSQLQREAA